MSQLAQVKLVGERLRLVEGDIRSSADLDHTFESAAMDAVGMLRA